MFEVQEALDTQKDGEWNEHIQSINSKSLLATIVMI